MSIIVTTSAGAVMVDSYVHHSSDGVLSVSNVTDAYTDVYTASSDVPRRKKVRDAQDLLVNGKQLDFSVLVDANNNIVHFRANLSGRISRKDAESIALEAVELARADKRFAHEAAQDEYNHAHEQVRSLEDEYRRAVERLTLARENRDKARQTLLDR